MTKYIIIFSAFVSSVSFAGDYGVANATNAANTSTAATKATTAATTTGANSGLTNAAGSSKSGSALAIVGEGITAGVGIYMGIQCAAPPYPMMPCFLAAQCAVQLISSLASQKSADGVNAAYSPDGGYSAVSGDPDLNGASSTSGLDGGTSGNGSAAANMASTTGGFAADLAKIQGSLAKAGVAIDSSGTGAPVVTMPNGTSVPLSSSPDSLKSAGFDPSQVDQTLADEKKLEASLAAKAGTNQIAFQTAGAGGKSVSYGANPNAGGSGDLDSYLKSLNANNRKPGSIGKANVAGLSRKLGEENIGVKGDNIFDMVNRRYQAQAKQNAFLKEK